MGVFVRAGDPIVRCRTRFLIDFRAWERLAMRLIAGSTLARQNFDRRSRDRETVSEMEPVQYLPLLREIPIQNRNFSLRRILAPVLSQFPVSILLGPELF